VLGRLYSDGEGVVQDYAEAARLYRPAATHGLRAARARLPLLQWQRRAARLITHSDYVEAARLLRLAVAQGHADAQYALGSIYLEGKGVPQDAAASARLLRLAAAQGHEHARHQPLANLYVDCTGVRAKGLCGGCAAVRAFGGGRPCGRAVRARHPVRRRRWRRAGPCGHVRACRHCDSLDRL
jgi:TPR repeat protein